MTNPIRLSTPERQAAIGSRAAVLAKSLGYAGSSEYDMGVNRHSEAEREARRPGADPEPPVYRLGR